MAWAAHDHKDHTGERQGRTSRPRYVDTVMEHLKPKYVRVKDRGQPDGEGDSG